MGTKITPKLVAFVKSHWRDIDNNSAAYAGLSTYRKELALVQDIHLSDKQLYSILNDDATFIKSIRRRKTFPRRALDLGGR